MDVKLDRYRIFCSVVQYGSFSAAAEALYLTQSAVRQNIRTLEESLSTTLFVRNRSGVTLTPAGKVLYEYASHAMSLLSSVEKRFAAIASLEEGELLLGASDTLCRHYLMPVLEQFHTRHEGIKLNITNGVTTETIRDLKNGKIEVAFINLPYPHAEEDETLCVRPSLPLHDVFVAGPRYGEYITEPLTLEEVAKLPLIMLERKSNSRNYVDRYFSENQVVLKPEFELGSHDLLLELAAANLGVACVTREFAGEKLANGSLVELPLAQPIPPRAVGICTSAHVPLSRAAEAFLDILNS